MKLWNFLGEVGTYFVWKIFREYLYWSQLFNRFQLKAGLFNEYDGLRSFLADRFPECKAPLPPWSKAAKELKKVQEEQGKLEEWFCDWDTSSNRRYCILSKNTEIVLTYRLWPNKLNCWRVFSCSVFAKYLRFQLVIIEWSSSFWWNLRIVTL